MTKLLQLAVNHNDKTVTATFNNKATLHLEYGNLQDINNVMGNYYSLMGKVTDHYELYLHLVPFTIESKPVYL